MEEKKQEKGGEVGVGKEGGKPRRRKKKKHMTAE